MLNHIHIIGKAKDMIGILRSFKGFTAHEILKNIIVTEPHVAEIFKQDNGGYEFWEKSNMPIIIESEEMFHQKLLYIHDNPVRKGYVREGEDYVWSSAKYYETGIQEYIGIDRIDE